MCRRHDKGRKKMKKKEGTSLSLFVEQCHSHTCNVHVCMTVQTEVALKNIKNVSDLGPYLKVPWI